MTEIAVGIDIGGTNTVFGIVNIHGKNLAEGSISTQKPAKVEEFVKKLASEIKSLLSSLSFDYKLVGIGIGAPNGNFHKGTIEFAPNLNWGEVVPLAELVKQHFGVSVWVTNDANAAALGEMLYGGARQMNNFIVITLGTGLGSGIVANEKLVYGHDGFAGELGHTTAVENGRDCACGRKGCLETYASATGIKRTVFELLGKSIENSSLRSYSYDDLTSKQIYNTAKEGDAIAIQAFDFTARILGKAFADAAAYTSPEAFFIFGGLANAEDLLISPIKKYMEENLLRIYKNKIKVLPSELKNGQAAILGASALVWSKK